MRIECPRKRGRREVKDAKMGQRRGKGGSSKVKDRRN